MKPLLPPHPLPHPVLRHRHPALHRNDSLQALAQRLAHAVLECGHVAAQRELGVDAVLGTLLEEEEAAVQGEPLLEVQVHHAAGEVGLGLEGGEVGEGRWDGGGHCGWG